MGGMRTSVFPLFVSQGHALKTKCARQEVLKYLNLKVTNVNHFSLKKIKVFFDRNSNKVRICDKSVKLDFHVFVKTTVSVTKRFADDLFVLSQEGKKFFFR